MSRGGNIAGTAAADWTVSPGTLAGTVSATASDFIGGILAKGSVAFAAGETAKLITVQVAGDAVGEFNESFTVGLSNLQTGVALGTASVQGLIWNDDAPGTGTLSIARLSAQKAEGHSASTAFTFTVTRSSVLTGTASADWAVAGGSVPGTVAANGADFTGGILPSGRVTFAAGQSSATVAVIVAGDMTAELNESFSVTLSGLQAGVTLAVATATGVIINDDFASTAANQSLTGTTSPDVFLLGGGLDSVTGGSGLDLFVFQPAAIGPAAIGPAAIGPAAGNATTMEDFNRALGEKLDLAAIDGNAIGGLANDAFNFIGTAAFDGTPGQLRWQDNGAVRLIQGNVNNDATADLTIFVKAAGPVDASWFVP